MVIKREVPLDLIDSQGRRAGQLLINLLPRTNENGSPPPLVDLRGDASRNPALEPVQLLESQEYRYRVILDRAVKKVDVFPEGLFEPRNDAGTEGTIKTRLHTGTVLVTIEADGEAVCGTAFEVRSRKLDYVSHYQWMLRDVTAGFAEVIMERFAPSMQRFKPDVTRDAPTLYQRFAFLQSLITGQQFEATLHQILARPHRAWISEEEDRRPGQAIPLTPAVMRQMSGPGARVQRPAHLTGISIPSLPATMRVARTEETLDTPENRFVKFVFTRWWEVVAETRQALHRERLNAPVKQGRREVDALAEHLGRLLSADLFREVGRMTRMPANSQVLQKRAGYRELFRAFVQFEAAALLTWEGGEDVYRAGQRNVAALYEYWVFLQLAELVAGLCQKPLDRACLIEERKNGLGIGLRQGEERVLAGSATRLGRRLHLELWFNRRFEAGAGKASWTSPMRPDCSLLIRPEDGSPASFDEVWIHFDAKYRIDNLKHLFDGVDDEATEGVETNGGGVQISGSATKADLLKMHAYRDAIRRSAGAYVIYPGDDPKQRSMYHEILPGLGAFALQPVESGPMKGESGLLAFIEDVLNHVASQGTQHERTQFWVRESYENSYGTTGRESMPFLTHPPADTPVLLGYVRAGQLDWVRRTGRYNLRAGDRTGSVGLRSRELSAQLLLLYGTEIDGVDLWRIVGEPEIWTRQRLLSTGYRDPGGDVYYCLRIEPVAADGLTLPDVERIDTIREQLKPGGSKPPVVTTWLELIK